MRFWPGRKRSSTTPSAADATGLIRRTRSAKERLVNSIFDAADHDHLLGHLVLKDLPERFFRQVVDQHNATIHKYLNQLPGEWWSFRQQVEELLIPTYAEFQRELADSDRKKQVDPQFRKARDFAVYRDWVLNSPPIATLFRETFFSKTYPAYIPEKQRRKHTFLVGASGSGKSETLKLLAIAAKKHPKSGVRRDCSFVLIDPHGDLAKEVTRQKHYAADFSQHPNDPDLISLDPTLAIDTGSFPILNPFDVRGKSDLEIEKLAQQLLSVIQSLVSRGDQSMTINMEALLVPCLTVLLHRPGSTLFDLLRFLDSKNNEDLITAGQQSSNAGHRVFFERAFLDSRYHLTKSALSTRIQTLLNNRIFASFLAGGNSTVDLEAALNSGKSIVLNCAFGNLGQQIGAAIGRFVVGMILGIAFNRVNLRKSQRVPIWLQIDEAQNFISDEIKILLTESRKYAVHLTLATQVVGQDMSANLSKIVLGNTAVKMIGSAGADSISTMAKEMHTPSEQLMNLDVGEFVVKSGRQPPIRMRMIPDYLGKQHQMSAQEWERLQRWQLEHYYRQSKEPTANSNTALENAQLVEEIEAGQPWLENEHTESGDEETPAQPRFVEENPFEELADPPIPTIVVEEVVKEFPKMEVPESPLSTLELDVEEPIELEDVKVDNSPLVEPLGFDPDDPFADLEEV